MLIQEVLTDLPPEEVIERAKAFFTLRFTQYAGFQQEATDHHVRFTSEAAELTLAVGTQHGRTLVRGSSSRMNHEVSQFLATLAPAEEVRQNVPGPGVSGGA